MIREGSKVAFDFKKEYREFYMPKNRPEIVTVPPANYIAVRGSGDPNEEGGAYKQAIGVLYAVAYTLKMSYKTDYQIEGFYQYVVPPLEGFWWQDGIEGVDYTNKAAFHWISVIRLPEFITGENFRWAVETAAKKKKMDWDEFLAKNGYMTDFSDTRLHHEIYMSDARKVPPEKWKTVIRHPIRAKEN